MSSSWQNIIISSVNDFEIEKEENAASFFVILNLGEDIDRFLIAPFILRKANVMKKNDLYVPCGSCDNSILALKPTWSCWLRHRYEMVFLNFIHGSLFVSRTHSTDTRC